MFHGQVREVQGLGPIIQMGVILSLVEEVSCEISVRTVKTIVASHQIEMDIELSFDDAEACLRGVIFRALILGGYSFRRVGRVLLALMVFIHFIYL